MICYVIVLFGLVLFGRFTKQTHLGFSEKFFNHSMSLNFIDYMVIQIKDIIDLNRIIHWRQINVSWAEISMRSLRFN